ncbi:hypothetical protein FDP41_000758 [Naegleria fowleri]|uniref:Glycosyl hydrolases family 39 N-terminal catalytic domain-containing protein n=1 Tax=Naegleria fowleri TaxID=5763 RepID=A0A6A5CHU4_NAEFO|nr:uncharacterized protein FDP41_000758 [Naegleria fowleri]KAF0984859.1 hypothetical protein FDP41_000758 [Naegleria fowleri]
MHFSFLLTIVGVFIVHVITCKDPSVLASSSVHRVLQRSINTTVHFRVHLDRSPQSPFHHYWKTSVGSGHASLCLHTTWREHVLKAKQELGFTGIRFHGIFSDDMSVVLGPGDDDQKPYYYSFFNVFNCFDFLLHSGIRPVVEIGFMPELFASNASQTVFHWKGIVSPPKRYDLWDDLISSFGNALVQRYGIKEVSNWVFEVWNEPNLRNGFWYGSKEEYFELYRHTALALKRAHKELRVGGPVTAFAEWIPEFIQFTKSNNVPLNFISTHQYPTDEFPVLRDFLWQNVKKTKSIVVDHYKLPLYYTEWNAGLQDGRGSHFYQDSAYPAAYIVKALFELYSQVELFSFWCVSDIFEEGGQQSLPFSGTYGLITNNGIRKPVWRAFELIGQSGDYLIEVEKVSIPSLKNSTVDAYATVNSKTGELVVFVTNWQIPGLPQMTYDVSVSFSNSLVDACTLTIIDETHSNAFTRWQQLNKPIYPTIQQIYDLQKSSELIPQSLKVNSDGTITISTPILSPSLHVIRCVKAK